MCIRGFTIPYKVTRLSHEQVRLTHMIVISRRREKGKTRVLFFGFDFTIYLVHATFRYVKRYVISITRIFIDRSWSSTGSGTKFGHLNRQ